MFLRCGAHLLKRNFLIGVAETKHGWRMNNQHLTSRRRLVSESGDKGGEEKEDPKGAKTDRGSVAVTKDLEEGMATPEELVHRKKEKSGVLVREDEDVGAVSGVPEEHLKNRIVVIYQPAQNPMQQGSATQGKWTLDYEARQRWENPLMGWCSGGDPRANATQVEFDTLEAAELYCKRHGLKYYVQSPNKPKRRKKSYADIYSWNRNTRSRTK